MKKVRHGAFFVIHCNRPPEAGYFLYAAAARGLNTNLQYPKIPAHELSAGFKPPASRYSGNK